MSRLATVPVVSLVTLLVLVPVAAADRTVPLDPVAGDDLEETAREATAPAEKIAYDAVRSVYRDLPEPVRQEVESVAPTCSYTGWDQAPILSESPPICALDDDATPGRAAVGQATAVPTRAPDAAGVPPERAGARADVVDADPQATPSADGPVRSTAPDLLPIVVAVALLVAVPAIWLYRRLSDDELLDNTVRRRVFEAIDHDPGITAAEIARERGIDYDTVRYHLRVLEEFDKVGVRDVDGRMRYFVDHGRYGAAEKTLRSLMASDARDRIVRSIAREGPLLAGELAKRAGVAPSTASHHLRRLHEAGVLDRDRRGNRVRYRVAPDHRELVHRVAFE